MPYAKETTCLYRFETLANPFSLIVLFYKNYLNIKILFSKAAQLTAEQPLESYIEKFAPL